MRLVCLSDTHNLHENLVIPEGDVLIHAGDCTDGGTERETRHFLDWFTAQPHPVKILVPGNHDFYFEKEMISGHPDLYLLIDEELVINKVKFWGSPYIPGQENWAFTKERGKAIRQHWNQIPPDTDVLITHTPAYGILDEIRSGSKLGCEELEYRISQIKPAYHLFGHIHHAAGSAFLQGTRHFNLSILDERFRIMHSPRVINVDFAK